MALIFYTTCIGMIYDYITIGTFYKYLNASFLFILICDFTLNFIILSLFLYKLQQLILRADFATDYNEIDIRDIKLNDHQIKMVTVMTRHTILSSIAIVFNIAFYITVLHGSNIEILDDADLWFLGYSNMVKALLGLTVAITLSLNFNFNINIYYLLCNKCHLCCYNMFVQNAKKQIQRQTADRTETANDSQL